MLYFANTYLTSYNNRTVLYTQKLERCQDIVPPAAIMAGVGIIRDVNCQYATQPILNIAQLVAFGIRNAIADVTIQYATGIKVVF